jgi:uncharacterized protein (DUF433 family)
MRKPKLNRVREKRITDEIVVDAYTSDERAMGWYYYLEDKLKFPVKGRCVFLRTVSPLKKGEEVEVPGMTPEDDCMKEMFVLVGSAGRRLGVTLVQLDPVKPGKATRARRCRTGAIGWRWAMCFNSHPPTTRGPRWGRKCERRTRGRFWHIAMPSVESPVYCRIGASTMNEADLLKRITVNPKIFGGKPIIRGMRISVEQILSLLAQGESEAAILADLPGLEADDIRACLAYAHAVIADDKLDAVQVPAK